MVWHFYDFSTIYYEFPNIQPITNINKIPNKEEKTLDPKRPSSPRPAATAAIGQPNKLTHGGESSDGGAKL